MPVSRRRHGSEGMHHVGQKHLLGAGVGGGLVGVADHEGQHAEGAADLLAGQAHALQAHPAVPGGSAQIGPSPVAIS